MSYFKDIFYRDGQGSTERTWYNVAGLAATFVVVYLACYTHEAGGVDIWAYVWIFAIYLITVGGFKVLLEMMRLLVSWKTGVVPSVVTETVDTSKSKTTTTS
jgi:hypothetical protein